MKKSAFYLLTIFLTSMLVTSCEDDRKCNDPEKCQQEDYRYRQRGYDCGGRGW